MCLFRKKHRIPATHHTSQPEAPHVMHIEDGEGHSAALELCCFCELLQNPQNHRTCPNYPELHGVYCPSFLPAADEEKRMQLLMSLLK